MTWLRLNSALKEAKPTALMVETISNPLLKVADIPALARLAHRYGASLLVDNTFATPCLLRPLLHGADYVIHERDQIPVGTWGCAGRYRLHLGSQPGRMFETNKLVGNTLGPFEAWLALRGLKTLPLRVPATMQQCPAFSRMAGRAAGRSLACELSWPGKPPATRTGQAPVRRSGNGRGFLF